MRFFTEELVANSRPHRQWWNEVSATREHFHDVESHLAGVAHRSGLSANATAMLPREAWLEMDDVTYKTLYGDDGQPYMTDLMALARPVHIGKLVVMHRISNGDGIVTRSMSGQVPEKMGKGDYDFRGTLIPIFSTGYGRSWREWNTYSSENFDVLLDDQEDHTRVLAADQAEYVLRGDETMKFEGQTGYGILNHPFSKSINLGPTGGANIDLTDPATSSDDIDAFFTGVFGRMLDDNRITSAVNLYISKEIARNWDRSYSGSAGFKGGRLMEYLMTNRRLRKIAVTDKLVGNQFFGFVPEARFIRPLVGMAVNTTAIARQNPVDDYNFMMMGALGLDIRGDWNELSGVFHSVEV